MNKELIKKYKAEFEHTLNDKEITFKFLDDNLGWRNPTILFPINYDKLNILIVKNDEYVEFRKALAEGKTVEVLTDTTNINRTYWDATLEVESYLRKKGAHQYFKFQLDNPSTDRGNYLFYVDCGEDYPKGFINGCSISKEDNLYNYTYKTLDNVYTWIKTQNIDTNIEVKNYRIKQEEQFKVGDWLFDLQYNKYYQIINILEDKVEIATFRVWKSAINDIDYKIWKPKPGELVIMETEDYSTGFTVTPCEENSKFIPVPFTGELPKNEKIKHSKTIREVCLSLGKDSSKADLLKELKKYGYTEQDFINYFGH